MRAWKKNKARGYRGEVRKIDGKEMCKRVLFLACEGESWDERKMLEREKDSGGKSKKQSLEEHFQVPFPCNFLFILFITLFFQDFWWILIIV